MENIPNDPMMLMSFINMKLRDFYPSLEALCEDLDINMQELVDKLAAAGSEHHIATNRLWQHV